MLNTRSKLLANGIEIYYEIHGQGTPLVLIAGFCSDHNFWSAMVENLAKYHQVILLDNRGIGQTDAPDSSYSIEQMADDVMSLLKSLDIKNPIIVGQSMGSAVGQKIAHKYGSNINRLILLNTFYQLTRVAEITFELVEELLLINTPLKYCVQTIAPWVYSSEFLSQPNQLQKLIDEAAQNPFPQSLIGYQRQLGALKDFCSIDWLSEIKTPTLIIAAEEDILSPVAGAQRVVDGIGENATFLLVPGGHASPIECPLKITKAIVDFTKH